MVMLPCEIHVHKHSSAHHKQKSLFLEKNCIQSGRVLPQHTCEGCIDWFRGIRKDELDIDKYLDIECNIIYTTLYTYYMYE